MVVEFCSALNGLHEIHMKALRTPRCITHLIMRAIRQCAGCSIEASTNGFIWFKVRDYRDSYDSGTSYLYALMLLRYVSDLFLT